MKWVPALSQFAEDLVLWHKGAYFLACHYTWQSHLRRISGLIARQQTRSLSPRANPRLQVRITCSNRDVIGHFCKVAASAVRSDGASPNSLQKLGPISDHSKGCLLSCWFFIFFKWLKKMFNRLNKIVCAFWFPPCPRGLRSILPRCTCSSVNINILRLYERSVLWTCLSSQSLVTNLGLAQPVSLLLDNLGP